MLNLNLSVLWDYGIKGLHLFCTQKIPVRFRIVSTGILCSSGGKADTTDLIKFECYIRKDVSRISQIRRML